MFWTRRKRKALEKQLCEQEETLRKQSADLIRLRDSLSKLEKEKTAIRKELEITRELSSYEDCVQKMREVMAGAYAMTDDQLQESSDFLVSEADDGWTVSLSFCQCGGHGYYDIRFHSKRSALEFAHLLSSFGKTMSNGICGDCRSEYFG